MASNTYYVRARISGEAEYTVEATSEQEAYDQIEQGYVDHDEISIDNVEDCEVIDVEYGMDEYKLTIELKVLAADQKCAEECMDTLRSTMEGKTYSATPDEGTEVNHNNEFLTFDMLKVEEN